MIRHFSGRSPSRREFLGAASLALLPATALAAATVRSDLLRFAKTAPRLGTLINIVVYATDRKQAERGLEAAFTRIDELDAILSDYRADSELNQLCGSAPHTGPVAASRELHTVLKLAAEIHRRSNGAFDVTVGPLTRLWRRARRKKKLPAPNEIEEALARVGAECVELGGTDSKPQIRITKAGVSLDLGGVAKGYIVDEALRALSGSGIQSALVNAGGDIGMSSAPPDSKGWNLGVSSVNTRGKPDRIVQMESAAVATSGDAFQAVTIDGKRYSHIVDPKTGIGLTRRSLVTVIAPNCATADAWASALSVMGAPGLKVFPKSPDYHARILTAASDGKLKLDETDHFPAGRAIDAPKPAPRSDR